MPKWDAPVFLEKIREHWKIENQLHWVKDIVMDEDKSQIKDKEIQQTGRLIIEDLSFMKKS